MKFILLFCFVFGFILNGKCQILQSDLFVQIDSLLEAPSAKPFNGKVLIAIEDSIIYKQTIGFSDIHQKIPFQTESQFVIGSISKQFTAVLALIEFEEMRLDLYKPIKFYLPEMNQSWADSVNTHHLLTHTHGIQNLDEPLAFEPGSKYQYSQIGYEFLGKILEQTSGKPFEKLSQELFDFCDMKNSSHPTMENYQDLVTAHVENDSGQIVFEPDYLKSYVAAGGFISTPEDLLLWNNQFYEGNLLKPKVMKLLTAKKTGAVRDHPLFGITDYGYGITVDTKENILQYGQTGLSPGFVSMNFYFPDTKLSVIATMNIQYSPDDLVETFDYLVKILNLVRSSELVQTIGSSKKRKNK
jgi:D-alanyl-D-alanine carboxypeptidase